MIRKQALKALALSVPLMLAVAAVPAFAGHDRYDRYRYDRGYDPFYDRDYRYDRDFERRYYQRGHVLSPREIAFRLRARGYSNIRDIRYSRRQGHYHAYAVDTLGSTFYLSISPYSGRVIHRRYLYGPQYPRYERDYYRDYY